MDDILFMNGHGIYVWIVYSVGTLLLSDHLFFCFISLGNRFSNASSSKKETAEYFIVTWLIFIGIFLILTALNSQLDLFYSPSELNKNNLPQRKNKLGGMVKKGSIKYEDTKVLFVLTDFEEDLDIEFDGFLQTSSKRIAERLCWKF